MSTHTGRRPGDGDLPPEPGRTASSASAPDTGTTPAEREPVGSPRRFWSARRVPAVIVALLSLAAVGLLLYDVVSVRAGRPAMGWRRRLADELATRPLDDVWIIVGAAVALVLGLCLVVLAVTPGLRSLLPMRRPPAVEERARSAPVSTAGRSPCSCATGPCGYPVSSRPGSMSGAGRSKPGRRCISAISTRSAPTSIPR